MIFWCIILDMTNLYLTCVRYKLKRKCNVKIGSILNFDTINAFNSKHTILIYWYREMDGVEGGGQRWGRGFSKWHMACLYLTKGFFSFVFPETVSLTSGSTKCVILYDTHTVAWRCSIKSYIEIKTFAQKNIRNFRKTHNH